MANRRPPDEAAVRRVVGGERLYLTPAERLLAVECLTGWSWSVERIAGQLRISVRTVHRYRARIRASEA